MFIDRHSIGFARGARGFSLIEAVVFIAVVAVGISGVLLAITTATHDSVDPLIRKQALAIAESLLEEIESMPFTYCDPDDPAAPTAPNAAACAVPEAIGPEAGETRYSLATPFDNVNDYQGFNMSPIVDLSNTPIAGLDTYTAAVTTTAVALNGANALLISVTVTGPRNTVVTVDGYRTQYAPNAVP
jgi:MSHA pilin protein MshD